MVVESSLSVLRKSTLADVVLALKNKDKLTSTSTSQPIKQNEDAEEEEEPTPPLERPHHLTQASFNWFPTTDLIDGKSSPSSYPSNSNHGSHKPLEMAPVFIEENEEEKESGTGFRGPFTIEDGERGIKNLSQENNNNNNSNNHKNYANSKRAMSIVGEESSITNSPSSSSSYKGKGKVIDGNSPTLGGGGGGEWEDELNDYVPNSENNKQQPLQRPIQRFRSKSLAPTRGGINWGGNSRKHSEVAINSTTEIEGGGGESSSLKDGKSKSLRNSSRPHPVKRATTQGWGAIRNKLRGSVAAQSATRDITKILTGHELITELTIGMLPMVLVKIRDEHGEPRIPVLLNYLKLRITDSIYPFHHSHAVFRIELEYCDGLVKWVIYRELKDFVNLHAHYRVSNLGKGRDKFPTFPKTSIPYLKWLKGEEKSEIARTAFAKAQREVLETYLLKLIRATMFGAGANRLCKFLEISAMSIALATRTDEQGKQGYLRIMSAASRRKEQGFHPFSWKKRHDPKWFLVRDSYILAVADPASTEIYDVFLIDSTFEIERPKRIFRTGMAFFSSNHDSDSEDEKVISSNKGKTSGKPGEETESATDFGLGPNDKPKGKHGAGDPLDPSATNLADSDPNRLRDSSTHTFYLKSSERKLRLVAKTERQQDQFIASIEKMVGRTIWAGKNRFDSFAPIRMNASAQWLVDGRDYFWSLSRAIMLAKEKIYIHDWWLSPELYLRRPAAENEKWRLDKLLQRKAREGVQIFVIIYKEVSNGFTPVDSNYTKTTLRGLHPNIHIQRSPSHTSTGTLLWSHHEKMCVIDETIGFMGGIDLCFGRWDTPGHVLVDDGPNPFDQHDYQNLDKNMQDSAQIWPGKDYANSRVIDFHTLDKPEEDMYDRGKVPRQPWHDIGLQIIGQPARDLCRHFIQRWNLLLRTKNHSVKMPFLIPAPDFTAKQLQEQRIVGTCEVQICRSAGPWSMGISHVEHSIQNAYIKAIQLSDHFVYIENQFFISSTEVEGTIVENKIGDALVSRILRAHSEGTPWRAIVVIPLVPGYPFPIDHSDAGSVRLIMECQNRTICRGERSIFARLRRVGIDPDEYITFFGLRGWGKLSSGALTTEAVYIHAKAMIVDDRTVIIGSANINERSQRGERDSELACIVRDTDMIDSTMAGKPYQVGRFAHTMRVRLMREHLGIDVDELEAEEADQDLLSREPPPSSNMKADEEAWDPDHEQTSGNQDGTQAKGHTLGWAMRMADSAKGNIASVARGATQAAGLGLTKGGGAMGRSFDILADDIDGASHAKKVRDEETSASKIADGKEGMEGFASSVVPTLEEKVMVEQRPHSDNQEDRSSSKLEKTPNQLERANGVATLPPRSGEEATVEDGKQISNDSESRLGDKVTQSNPEVDDTRKLTMERDAFIEKDGEKIHPQAPITSNIEGQPPRIQDEAPPPDIAKASDGNESREDLNNSSPKVNGRSPGNLSIPLKEDDDSLNEPKSPTSATSNRSLANEQAVNRNTVTSTLRKNLREKANAYTIPTPAPIIDSHGFADPLVDSFFKEVLMTAAVRNTQAYRKVFRCVPDDLVQTWKQYREFQTWAERHNKAPKDVVPPGDDAPYTDPAHHSGQQGSGGGGSGGGAMGQGVDDPPVGDTMLKESHRRHASTNGLGAGSTPSERKNGGGDNSRRAPSNSHSAAAGGENHDHDEGFPAAERDQMEECLNEVRGHLVVYPTRFLEAESIGGNFLYSKDRLAPMAIYD